MGYTRYNNDTVDKRCTLTIFASHATHTHNIFDIDMYDFHLTHTHTHIHTHTRARARITGMTHSMLHARCGSDLGS